jgi:hypothetical protein
MIQIPRAHDKRLQMVELMGQEIGHIQTHADQLLAAYEAEAKLDPKTEYAAALQTMRNLALNLSNARVASIEVEAAVGEIMFLAEGRDVAAVRLRGTDV